MQHREVGVGGLLPADQDASEAIHPAVGPLDDPAACAVKEAAAKLADLLSSSAQMKREAEQAGETPDEGEVVALVEAHALSSVRLGTRTSDRNAVHGVREELAVISIRGGDDQADRDPATVGQQAALGASFGAVRRIRAGFFPRRAEPWS